MSTKTTCAIGSGGARPTHRADRSGRGRGLAGRIARAAIDDGLWCVDEILGAAAAGHLRVPGVSDVHRGDADRHRGVWVAWDETTLDWVTFSRHSLQRAVGRLLKGAVGMAPRSAPGVGISIVPSSQSQTSSRSTTSDVGEVGEGTAIEHGRAGSSPSPSPSLPSPSPTSDNSIGESTITATPVSSSTSSNSSAVTPSTIVDPDAPPLDTFAEPWPEEAGTVDVADPYTHDDPDWACVLRLRAHHGLVDAVTIAEPGLVPREHIDAFRARLLALGIEHLGFIESDNGTHLQMFVPAVFTATVRAVYLEISGAHDRGPDYPGDRVVFAKPVSDARGWLRYCRKSGGERL